MPPEENENPEQRQETETRTVRSLTRARILGGTCLGLAGILAITALILKDDNGAWLGEEIDPIVKAAPIIAVAPDAEPLPPLGQRD